ncbi:hypothetical protein KPA96_13665 [Burkholderia cenocepacia]|uniref:hypothetical protein n=1 Tax=Burkholderia cenocepacia TaxID=95486 RepID=UPI0028657701|nr:hypothetical protein [Burkholderia cenocepacia]MDR8076704.1 hypothetical protein [Burkholderia cenocepacia]
MNEQLKLLSYEIKFSIVAMPMERKRFYSDLKAWCKNKGALYFYGDIKTLFSKRKLQFTDKTYEEYMAIRDLLNDLAFSPDGFKHRFAFFYNINFIKS